MARKLKVYQTSSGFFDLAIAAPSMKAAADAWGSRTNVFKQGLAKETSDPSIVAAAMAKPGLVLRRPVGSNETFRQHANLPKTLPGYSIKDKPAKTRPQPKDLPPRNVHPEATRAAAIAFEREQKRREMARRKEEVAREQKRRRREKAIANAERAFEKAEREHDTRTASIEKARAALDKRSRAEEARWAKQKEKLETAIRRSRD